jgi:hypothetical protein
VVRPALRMAYPAPPFSLRHLGEGGTRVGKVVRLVEAVSWVDGIMLVDDNEIGDAFLENIGPDGGDLPISIGFRPLPGGSVEYPGQGSCARRSSWSRSRSLTSACTATAPRTYPRGFLPPPDKDRAA